MRSLSCLVKELHKSVRYTKCQVNNEISVERVLERLKVDYIKQPNGCQMAPDFRVTVNKESLDIECKSSKKHYIPMWNSTFPNNKTVYLFSNQKDNKTIVFNGSSIMTKQVEKIYQDYSEKLKELQKETNDKLKIVPNPYNMRVYARKMFSQGKNLQKHKTDVYLQDCLSSLGKRKRSTDTRDTTDKNETEVNEPIAKRTRFSK